MLLAMTTVQVRDEFVGVELSDGISHPPGSVVTLTTSQFAGLSTAQARAVIWLDTEASFATADPVVAAKLTTRETDTGVEKLGDGQAGVLATGAADEQPRRSRRRRVHRPVRRRPDRLGCDGRQVRQPGSCSVTPA